MSFVYKGYGDHLDLHVLTHSFPPRRSSDLTVVGPVCETGDTFARNRDMDMVQAGDLLAFMTAGAYGATMASTYNSRALTPEVLVSGDKWAVVRERPPIEIGRAHV